MKYIWFTLTIFFIAANCYADFNDGMQAMQSKNYTDAYKYFIRDGSADSMNALGVIYNEGYGVARDYKEAANWYAKAAAKGHSFAQSNLGALYEQGLGVKQDINEAAKLYRKAADQGCPEGIYNLAKCYYSGKGVAKNIDEALKLMKLSADNGFAEAQYTYGVTYIEGLGSIRRNYELGKKYIIMAAKQGHAKAIKTLNELRIKY